MLNALRSSGSNIVVWVIIGLLIIGLAGFGIQTSGGGGARAVASVGEEPVTIDEYARAYSNQANAITAQVGRALTTAEMRAAGMDQAVLDGLLSDAAISNEANRIGLSAGDERVREALMATPAFQGTDGRFSRDTYEFALERGNLTPGEYDDIIRKGEARNILRAAVMGGVVAPETAARAIVGYQAEERALEWTRLTADNLEDPIGDPDEAALTAHYEANPAAYRRPETRKITYAYVTEETLFEDISVDEADVVALYEDRAEDYNIPARLLLDRIVYPDQESADAAVDAHFSGEKSFDELAADRGLGAEAIDMGEVDELDLNPEERAVLFAANGPGVYGPLPSDLGPAIYRVNAKLAASETALEDVREELFEELARVEAADLIANEVLAIEDLIAGGASVEDIARETFMELGSIEMTADTAEGIAADIAFREEAFAAEEGEERDLFDLSDGVAYLRVDSVTDAAVPPLAEVRSQVAQDWRAAETVRRLVALAQSQKARIDEGETLGAVASDLDLIVNEEPPLGRGDIIEDTPPSFVTEIFETEPGKGVVVEDGDSVLLARITEVIAADMGTDDISQSVNAVRAEIAQALAQDVLQYYILGLQNSAGTSVNQAIIEQIQTQIGN